MIKVAKFGGSSLACATQMKKVMEIIKNDCQIRYVVVSAPGKEFDHDIKITDSLIDLGQLIKNQKDYNHLLNAILTRLNRLCQELEIDEKVIAKINDDLQKRIDQVHRDKYYFIDYIKAFGEDASAHIMANYLTKKGIDAKYLSPGDIGLRLSHHNETIHVLDQSFVNIKEALKNEQGVIIIPGFYGLDEQNNVITFDRGGSDLTGAIIASSINALVYENYTDVDYVYAASPKLVKNPLPIYQLTYKEMRELAYAGFNVLHEETILPLHKLGIPIKIKNTNNPQAQGTKIVTDYDIEPNFITGLAGKGGFTSIYLHKFLMNREVGFVRKLLNIFEDEGVPFEHSPSGIDYISIILQSTLFYSHNYQRIITRIREELDVDDINIIDDLAIVVIVGEKIIEKNILGHSIVALEKCNIKVLSVSLAQLGDSLILVVNKEEMKPAIKVLYDELFLKTN